MKRFIVIFLLSTLCFLLSASFLYADELSEMKAQVKALQARIEALEAAQEETEETIENIPAIAEGLKIGAGATFIVQGTKDANATASKGEDVTDTSYSIDLIFEKEFDDFGMALLQLETGDGAGVEDELTLFSNVNRDTDDSNNSVSVTKAWYEHYLFDKQLAITFGKIDAGDYLDQNKIACDECAQFLGRMFKHASTIQFPDNNAGIHGVFSSDEAPWLEIEAQVLDGDDDWEDIGDEVFASGQVNLRPELIEGRECNYRFYGWYKDTDHIEWRNNTNMQEENYGFGTSIDQEITDVLTLFGRYGWQNPEVYASGVDFSLEHSWSAGARIMGSPWDREEDYIGLAVGMEVPSDDYKETQSRTGDSEGHFEAYYYCQLNDHLSISPDFQLIWDAYGNDVSDREDTIYVFGSRAQVDF